MCFDKKKTKLGISKEPILINQIANYFLEIVIDSSVAEPEPTLLGRSRVFLLVEAEVAPAASVRQAKKRRIRNTDWQQLFFNHR